MTPYTLVDHLPPDYAAKALRNDALRGLTADPKTLPPKWFYDKAGSDLFEQITVLPEYYPTRAEREILVAYADDIAAASGAATLVELGSGASVKTRLLLDALHPNAYVALDVSEAALREAADGLARDYPALQLTALVADFEHQLSVVPAGAHRLVAFLGGTIGNLEPVPRAQFLADLRGELRDGDAFLLGADLVKSPRVLLPAYDDAAGVTAAFNRNVLHVLNNGLGADFDPASFDHVAHWDPVAEWIEMRLLSRVAQVVTIRDLDLRVRFDRGEQLRTEVSAKFRREGLTAELAAAGFDPGGWWTDSAGRFSLSLWHPAARS
ncbi:MAG: L-histidine N(alpha)-methyltransferase [Actinomycetota bacterium]|nr:MAG: L-histidine N(alpha)-methyltransferase [Actinomycetota bacterium]